MGFNESISNMRLSKWKKQSGLSKNSTVEWGVIGKDTEVVEANENTKKVGKDKEKKE